VAGQCAHGHALHSNHGNLEKRRHLYCLFLVGLQNIPRELYEAASLDGATAFRQFRHITFPMLNPP